MIIRKIIFIITITYCIFNTSRCISTSIENIDGIGFIINNEMVSKKNIYDILNIFNYIHNNENKLLNSILDINNVEDLIKNNLFLQIIKNNNFYISKNNLNNFISEIYQQNNINENLLKKKFIKNHIDYKTYLSFMRKSLLIYMFKNILIKNTINIFDEEINSLSNQLYLKSKFHRKYNITLFYLTVNKSKSLLKNDFNYKLKLISKLLNILKNNKLNNHIQNIESNLFISNAKIKKITLKGMEDELPLILINYLDKSKKGNIIGPIYLYSKIFILKINNVVLINNINNKKVLLRFIYINKYNFNKKNIRKKIDYIYLNLLKKKITFKKAMKLLLENKKIIKFKEDIIWIPLNSFYINFQKIIGKLKINQFSLPIKKYDGYYIIQLLNEQNNQKTKIFFQQQAYDIILKQNFEKESNFFIYEYAKTIYIKNFIK
ncbi:peptidylprolyl isomerase [Enterobacteriaceae endosymbiont of Donacia semicuprea]|uniref:peptidylprolyl isomerase n=1 Tax=Enterobacteriaceae endosymbiont of Donacia semicuprea TaxID=2675783 RepID=UPI0014495CAD|nr:peptidylprolyl isomerase [Enterobacteriaceae endosymbiont of Donacia semicuprea]QJC32839.1 hypothetical protein GJT91_00790 [Enterobacteriaceae endosymbiont of Donacia semicuprea]